MERSKKKNTGMSKEFSENFIEAFPTWKVGNNGSSTSGNCYSKSETTGYTNKDNSLKQNCNTLNLPKNLEQRLFKSDDNVDTRPNKEKTEPQRPDNYDPPKSPFPNDDKTVEQLLGGIEAVIKDYLKKFISRIIRSKSMIKDFKNENINIESKIFRKTKLISFMSLYDEKFLFGLDVRLISFDKDGAVIKVFFDDFHTREVIEREIIIEKEIITGSEK